MFNFSNTLTPVSPIQCIKHVARSKNRYYSAENMWEREILEGIEKVLDKKGKFNPELDSSTIRSEERTFYDIVEA